MEISSEQVKQFALELGADIVGIAKEDSFIEAPLGTQPRDVLPECMSVIVLACEFPKNGLDAEAEMYTFIRNQMVDKMDKLAIALTTKLKEKGAIAYPLKSVATKTIDGKMYGTISLKHAAELAGMGRIGKNTLLINEKLGNMLWLSAVLTSAALVADPVATYEVCSPACSLCLNVCPVKAFEKEPMQQLACYNHAFTNIGGHFQIECWECRKVCPNHLGIISRSK